MFDGFRNRIMVAQSFLLQSKKYSQQAGLVARGNVVGSGARGFGNRQNREE
jgi:hypothetical protein